MEMHDGESHGRYKYAMAGAAICYVAFGVIGALFARIAGGDDMGWGFAIGVGAFVGLWAGVGFGLMAGNAMYQAKFSHH